MTSATPIFPTGIFNSPFKPARWLSNPHAQTVFPRYHRRQPLKLERQRSEFLLADGDHLWLDSYRPKDIADDAMLVLVIHGLSGSSDSQYVLGLQQSLAQQGWPSVAMNCRGAIQPNKALQAYHAGASHDVIQVLWHLLDSQELPVAVVGYSLGGSMTLKALAEIGSTSRLLAGVAVSAPLHLASCANRMDTGLSQAYRHHLLTELAAMWRKKALHLRKEGQILESELIERCLAKGPFRSFWQFDDLLMAPLHGFKNVHDYYEQCTAGQFLRSIQTPTLVIHAQDDPFMLPTVIPAASQLSPAIHFELARQGGHVGFVSGSLRNPYYYLERRIPAFLKHVRVQSH